MRLSEKQTAAATRCLWSLQEAAPDIEGLLLTHIDGLTLTTTMEGGDSTQRLAAVSTAMFLLGEEASESWGRGESVEVAVKLVDEDSSDDKEVRYVYMQPAGHMAVLIAVCRSSRWLMDVKKKMRQTAVYLDFLLRGDEPSEPDWHI